MHGHAIYLDSEWALTSISQRQFWRDVDFGSSGSAECSRSTSPSGSGRAAAPARSPRCARPRRSATRSGASSSDHLEGVLDGVEVASWFLDEAIEFPNPSGATNAEPLLVNTKGSWADRPDATTRIPNLILAADYVRTYTDLATMEGANEAARRAVNAILDATRLARGALRGLAAARAARVAGRRARWTSCSGACGGRPRHRSRVASREVRRRRLGRLFPSSDAERGGVAIARRGALCAPPLNGTRSRPAIARALLQPLEPVRLDRPRARPVAETGCCAAQARNAARELVAVDAGEVHLGELAPGAVVGLGGDPGARVRASCPPRGRRPARASCSPAIRIAVRVARHLHHVLPEERPGLQRARQRPEPAQVDVDLAQPRIGRRQRVVLGAADRDRLAPACRRP